MVAQSWVYGSWKPEAPLKELIAGRGGLAARVL